MPLPEVYLAIQQGAVSGQENPDRHDPRQQVLRGRAERHADAARLQPDPADHLRKDVAEAVAGGSRGGDQGGEGSGRVEPQGSERQRRPPAGGHGKRRAPRIVRPNIGPWRDAVKPVYVKAKEKYGADVDADPCRRRGGAQGAAGQIASCRCCLRGRSGSPRADSRRWGVVVDWTIVAIGGADDPRWSSSTSMFHLLGHATSRGPRSSASS